MSSYIMDAAEKRRLLREKRAAKMAKNGDRLNKILGHEVHGNSPPPTTSAAASTSASASGSTTRTLAGEENVFDDPPVSNLDEFEHFKDDDALHEIPDVGRFPPYMDEMFKKMLNSSQGAFDATSTPSGVAPTPVGRFQMEETKMFMSFYSIVSVIFTFVLVTGDIANSSRFINGLFPWNMRLVEKFLVLEFIFTLIQLVLHQTGAFKNTVFNFDVTGVPYANTFLTLYAVASSFFTDFSGLLVAAALNAWHESLHFSSIKSLIV